MAPASPSPWALLAVGVIIVVVWLVIGVVAVVQLDYSGNAKTTVTILPALLTTSGSTPRWSAGPDRAPEVRHDPAAERIDSP